MRALGGNTMPNCDFYQPSNIVYVHARNRAVPCVTSKQQCFVHHCTKEWTTSNGTSEAFVSQTTVSILHVKLR